MKDKDKGPDAEKKVDLGSLRVKPVDMPPGNLEIMNVEGLAAYLGLSVRTVYNMAHDGEVPGTKVAGSWRFPKAAIDSWLMEKAKENLGRGETGGNLE